MFDIFIFPFPLSFSICLSLIVLKTYAFITDKIPPLFLFHLLNFPFLLLLLHFFLHLLLFFFSLSFVSLLFFFFSFLLGGGRWSIWHCEQQAPHSNNKKWRLWLVRTTLNSVLTLLRIIKVDMRLKDIRLNLHSLPKFPTSLSYLPQFSTSHPSDTKFPLLHSPNPHSLPQFSLTPRLIWFLWRQACRVEPSDPESVITELEAACTESHLAHQEGAVCTVWFSRMLFIRDYGRCFFWCDFSVIF